MMFSPSLVCLALALVCFVASAFNYSPVKIRLSPLGLAFWVLSQMLR